MDQWGASGQGPGSGLFEGLPVPVCLVDGDGRLRAVNRAARRMWAGLDAEDLLGHPAMPALGIVPSGGSADAWTLLSAPGTLQQLDCRISTPDGQVRQVSLIYAPLEVGDPALAALFFVDGDDAAALAGVPDWALQDPVTGLGNRHRWEREGAAWSERSGCVAFFDLDDLKEVNDLHGHVAGDRMLAAVGSALASRIPPDALAVRYGGDEFVVLLPWGELAAVEEWAAEAVRHVAAAASSVHLPLVPRLSHGVAAFGPGELRAAVQQADDALYERKGVLLRAGGGGRIILTREGRSLMRSGETARGEPPPGSFGAGFGSEFDGYFRAAFARSRLQAEHFIDFVAPREGDAVVEVGAGAGRITLDGGLARRVGPSGQVLATDPSSAQLEQARQRAGAEGLEWVRFLRAAAEELPVASATADLVLGSTFLHFTDPPRALREMARVIRPGGRLALQQPLNFPWTDLWGWVLEPLRTEAERHGVPLRHLMPDEEELRAHLAGTGLTLEAWREGGPDHMDLPGAEVAVVFWRQATLVAVLLRGVPAERQRAAQEAFEARIRQAFARGTREELRLSGRWIDCVLRKPSA